MINKAIKTEDIPRDLLEALNSDKNNVVKAYHGFLNDKHLTGTHEHFGKVDLPIPAKEYFSVSIWKGGERSENIKAIFLIRVDASSWSIYEK
jgi:hypothetical protein